MEEGEKGEGTECGSESDEDVGTGGSISGWDLGSPVVSVDQLNGATWMSELTQHFDDSLSPWRDTIQSYQTVHQLIVQ